MCVNVDNMSCFRVTWCWKRSDSEMKALYDALCATFTHTPPLGQTSLKCVRLLPKDDRSSSEQHPVVCDEIFGATILYKCNVNEILSTVLMLIVIIKGNMLIVVGLSVFNWKIVACFKSRLIKFDIQLQFPV